MTAPQELRTSRLLLRSLERDDISSIARFAGAREVAATTVRIPHPYSEDDARQFLAKAEEDFGAGLSISFAVTVPATQELCGGIGLNLDPLHQHAELGYWIALPFWGNGFATEAATAVIAFGFKTLGLHRIYAYHFAGNTASQRVLEKAGMRHEGRSRQHIRKWNQFIDLENYGVLADEFQGGE